MPVARVEAWPPPVIPAKAGVEAALVRASEIGLGSRYRGDDGSME
jgi:hypothetical protein